MTSEAKARQQIDDKLAAAGCEVQAEIARVLVLVEHRALAAEQRGALEHALGQTVAQRKNGKNVLQAALSGQLVPQDPRDIAREMA